MTNEQRELDDLLRRVIISYSVMGIAFFIIILIIIICQAL
jgi:hypothetical protein